MQAEGQPTGSDELLRRVMTVVELTADNYSSMYQDMELGRETEIEAITGFLLAGLPATASRCRSIRVSIRPSKRSSEPGGLANARSKG